MMNVSDLSDSTQCLGVRNWGHGNLRQLRTTPSFVMPTGFLQSLVQDVRLDDSNYFQLSNPLTASTTTEQSK
jgi:hypothetical protein